MKDLNGFRVGVIVTDGVEQVEFTEPVKALKDAGATVTVVGVKEGDIQGVHHLDKGDRFPIDRVLDEVEASDFDGLMLPGGAVNADALRVEKKLHSILRDFQDTGKPIAAICHAPWELISAGVVRGRTLTSYHTIQDDIRNAGGNWVDESVVRDGNFVTSRNPGDLVAFNQAMIELFQKSAGALKHKAVG